MGYVRSRINKILELIKQLPSDTVPPIEIDTAFVSRENFLKATSVAPAIQDVVNFLTPFAAEIFDPVFASLPQGRLREINDSINEILSALHDVLGSIVRSGDSMVQIQDENFYRGAAERIIEQYFHLHNYLAPLQSAAVLQKLASLDLDQVKQRYDDLLDDISAQRSEIAEEKKEAEASIFTAENITFASEVITYHEKQARSWLYIFAGTVAATIALLWILYFDVGMDPIMGWLDRPDLAIPKLILKAVSKVIFATFAVSVCVVVGRIYQSHVHNVVVNQQRKMAAVSFYHIYKQIAEKDESSRKDLVVHAGEAIFRHVSTGFLNKGNNEVASLIPIATEIVKKIRP